MTDESVSRGAPRKYDRERIARLYQDGKTLRETAEEVGCHFQTVLRILKDLGVERRCHGRRPGTKIGPTINGQDIIRLYKAGYSIREVARQVGCSFQNVHNTLVYNNIPRRPAHINPQRADQ